MTGRSPLEDPDNASFAWARYRRLMRIMVCFTVFTVVAALGALYWINGPISVHFYIATGLGITVSMMLMAGLMGLVFLSSGTGHDEAVDDRIDDESVW